MFIGNQNRRQRRSRAGRTPGFKRGLRRVLGLSFMIVAGTTLYTSAGAQPWQWTPSITLGAHYDDNPLLTTADHDSASGGFAEGELAVSRTRETDYFVSRLRADYISYNSDELDDEDAQYLDLESRKATERSTLGIKIKLQRDTTRRATLDETDIDQGLFEVQTRRYRLNVKPHWSWRLTELNDLLLDYRLILTDYERNDVGATDYTEHQLNGGFSRRLSERTTASLLLGVSEYRNEDEDREFDTFLSRARFDYAVTETLEGRLSAGWRETRFSVNGSDDEDSGYLLSLEGIKRGELSSYRALVEHDIYPSGSGNLVEANQFLLELKSRLSPRSDLSVQLRAYEAQSLVGNGNKRTYAQGSPIVSWYWTPTLKLEASYRYRFKDRDADPDTATSNAVFLSLNYTPRSIFQKGRAVDTHY